MKLNLRKNTFLKRVFVLLPLLGVLACGNGNKELNTEENSEGPGPLTSQESKTGELTLSEQFSCNDSGFKFVDLSDPKNAQLKEFSSQDHASLYDALVDREGGLLSALTTYKKDNDVYLARNAVEGFVPGNPGQKQFVKAASFIEVLKNGISLGSIDVKAPVHHLRFVETPNVGLELYASTDRGIFRITVGASLNIVSQFMKELGISSMARADDGVVYATTFEGHFVKWMPDAANCAFVLYDADSSRALDPTTGERMRAVQVELTDKNAFFLTKNFGGFRTDLEMFSTALLKFQSHRLFHFNSILWFVDLKGESPIKQVELKQNAFHNYYLGSFTVDRYGHVALGMKLFADADVTLYHAANNSQKFTKWFQAFMNAKDVLALVNDEGRLFQSVEIEKIQFPGFEFPNLALFFFPRVASPTQSTSACEVVMRGMMGYACFKSLNQVNPVVITTNMIYNDPNLYPNVVPGLGIKMDFNMGLDFENNFHEISLFSSAYRTYDAVAFQSSDAIKIAHNLVGPYAAFGNSKAMQVFSYNTVDIDGALIGQVHDFPKTFDLYQASGMPFFQKNASSAEDRIAVFYRDQNADTAKLRIYDAQYTDPPLFEQDFASLPLNGANDFMPLTMKEDVLSLAVNVGPDQFYLKALDLSTAQATLFELGAPIQGKLIYNVDFEKTASGDFESLLVVEKNNTWTLKKYRVNFTSQQISTLAEYDISQAVVSGQGPVSLYGDKVIVLLEDNSVDVLNSDLELQFNSGSLGGVNSGQAVSPALGALVNLLKQTAIINNKLYLNVMTLDAYNQVISRVSPQLFSLDLNDKTIQRFPNSEYTSIFECGDQRLCASSLSRGLEQFQLQ